MNSGTGENAADNGAFAEEIILNNFGEYPESAADNISAPNSQRVDESVDAINNANAYLANQERRQTPTPKVSFFIKEEQELTKVGPRKSCLKRKTPRYRQVDRENSAETSFQPSTGNFFNISILEIKMT